MSVPAGFPLGRWTMTVTEADMRAAGFTDAALITENVAVYTYTRNPDGTWTSVAQSDQPLRWPVFRGTYRITGADTFEETVEFPPEYAGEVARYTWQLVNDELVIRIPDPPDPVLKVLTEAHPWRPVE